MLKIKQLRVYQPVYFENNPCTYFNNKGWGQVTNTVKAPIVDIQETEEGVLIKSDKDVVKIFRTNIAYISYFEVAEEKPSKAK